MDAPDSDSSSSASRAAAHRGGPLQGVRIVEFTGLGPAPFAAMLLADLGADIVRIDRPGRGGSAPSDITFRGRRCIELDLKSSADVNSALALVDAADALIEGFRPGVMERLGLGPDLVLARNRRLVYGRMTGWGQEGPLSRAAGHDINYIAITGALAAIGPGEGRPVPPLNLVGDYGGGAMYLVAGILAGLLSAKSSGHGQVIDCAMCDGASHLLTLFHGFRAEGTWTDEREANLLDGGAHFYGTYECADGKYVAVGALEPKFYAELCARAGLDADVFGTQEDRGRWPDLKIRAAEIFRQRTRAQWCEILEGTDACVAPVLTMAEAPSHPHLRARGTLVDVDGVLQAAPAPRFSGTPAVRPQAPPCAPTPLSNALQEWGIVPSQR